MRVKITYPSVTKAQRRRPVVIRWATWLSWFSAIVCAVVNILTGGPAWTFIFLWTLWAAWAFVISPTLVEYNRLSFSIRIITGLSTLFLILGALFSTSLAIRVVPIVCFSGLVIAGFLLFTDLGHQKQNMMPMLMLIAISLAISAGGLIVWRVEGRWAFFVMGGVACTLLVLCFLVMGRDFVREFKKRFHTK